MGTKKRVVGVLLGNWSGQTVNITNSYAGKSGLAIEHTIIYLFVFIFTFSKPLCYLFIVPFEEDENVWFLDHNYHESMNELSKKVNAKERPVGWYHTGPKLRSSDLEINEVFRKYCTHSCPTLLIVDPLAAEDRIGLPFDAFASVDTLSQQEEGSNSLVAETAQKVFVHLPSVVEAEEAEEIGVEHLLRDVKDNVVGDLSTKITQKTDSLVALQQQLQSIMDYLRAVQSGKIPANPAIIYRLQEMFNLLPDVHSQEALKALQVAANDQAMMLYAGGLVQTVIVLHDLVNNKLENVQ